MANVQLPSPVRYVGSYTGDLPAPSLPEVAFAGRSNVGKSSAINALTGVGGLARVSKTPGRTQALNLFDVGGVFGLVDLPGYGHAQVSRDLRASWKGWIEDYLFRRPTLRLVVSLVDARIPPQEPDKVLLRGLVEARVPTLVIATKIDDVSRNKRLATLAALARGLGIGEDQLLGFSATENIGIDEGREMILAAVGYRPRRR